MKNIAALFVIFLLLVTAVMPVAFAQEAEREFRKIFCPYVAIFSEQIARNRIRNVPYSRLDDFDYFGENEGEFLSAIASEIYNLPLDAFNGMRVEIGSRYRSDCEERFSG